MKTAREWFETLGAPIVAGPGIRRHPHYEGFRAFNEYDIAEIQRDALELHLNEATICPSTIVDAITAAVLDVVSPEGHEPEDEAQIREAVTKAIDKITLDANAPRS